MPENNFEKQVQDLFDGFKLKPSDEVWQHVNERINEGKKDRNIFFWLPALLLLMVGSAGAYLKWGSNNDSHIAKTTQSAQPVQPSAPQSLTTTEKENTNAAEKKTESATTKEHDLVEQSSNEANQQNEKDILPVNEGENKNTKEGSRSGSLPGTFSSENETRTNKQAAVKHVEKMQSDVLKPLPVSKNTASIVNKEKKKSEYKNNSHTTFLQDSESKDISTEEDAIDDKLIVASQQQVISNTFILAAPAGEKSLKTIAKTNTPISLSKKKVWEFGVTTSVGVSKVGNGLSGIFSKSNVVEKSALNADAMVVYNSNAGFVASQNNNYLAALPPTPTPVKPGISWAAGASAKWYIKSRLALSGSAQYSYYTTSREVGNLLNTGGQLNYASSSPSASRYAGTYSNIGGSQYTNKYHLFEVPLGIQWQLNKGIKFAPIQLNTGVSVGWLISTNTLHYDKISGSYYEDKSLFNTVHAGLYAGLSAKLFQHSNRPLYIGPFVQYGFSNLLKSSAEASQNLIFGGIKAEWILWKK